MHSDGASGFCYPSIDDAILAAVGCRDLPMPSPVRLVLVGLCVAERRRQSGGPLLRYAPELPIDRERRVPRLAFVAA